MQPPPNRAEGEDPEHRDTDTQVEKEIVPAPPTVSKLVNCHAYTLLSPTDQALLTHNTTKLFHTSTSTDGESGFAFTNNGDIYGFAGRYIKSDGNGFAIWIVYTKPELTANDFRKKLSLERALLKVPLNAPTWSSATPFLDAKIVQIVKSTGGSTKDHFIALSNQGQVFAWGRNNLGQLGTGDMKERQEVTIIPSTFFYDKQVKLLAGNGTTSFAVTTDLRLFMWGKYLGKNYTLPSLTHMNSGVRSVFCGLSRYIVMTNDGKVGDFGINSGGEDFLLKIDQVVVDIAANGKIDFFVCETVSKKIYVWGAHVGLPLGPTAPTSYTSMEQAFVEHKVPEYLIIDDPVDFWKKRSYLRLLSRAAPQLRAHALETGVASDITLILGRAKEEVKAHLAVLLELPVLKPKQGLASDGKLIFEDVDPPIFKLFLKYLYTGNWNVKWDEILRLLNLATHYNMTGLMDKCTSALAGNLTLDNVLPVFENARQSGNQERVTTCLAFICKSTSQLITMDVFLSLGVDSLVEILQQDDLHVKNESQLFQAICRWGEHEAERQGLDPKCGADVRKVLADCWAHIRFPQMFQTDFKKALAVHLDLFSKEEIVSILLKMKHSCHEKKRKRNATVSQAVDTNGTPSPKKRKKHSGSIYTPRAYTG